MYFDYATWSDLADVSRLVRRHMPDVEFLEMIGQELVFLLPYTGATDGSFASLFKELDLEKKALGITSYGISDTSLEEVQGPILLLSKWAIHLSFAFMRLY